MKYSAVSRALIAGVVLRSGSECGLEGSFATWSVFVVVAFIRLRERERETERETERQRQRERETDRQTDRQTDRERERAFVCAVRM